MCFCNDNLVQYQEDTMSAIVGPLFLTDRQLITPKDTGPEFSEISPHNKSKTEMPLNLVAVGKFFHIMAIAYLPERTREQ